MTINEVIVVRIKLNTGRWANVAGYTELSKANAEAQVVSKLPWVVDVAVDYVPLR